MKPTLLFALITLTSNVAASLHAEDRMRPGLWEVTRVVDGKEPNTTRTCYTPAMVALANKPASELREAAEKRNAKMGCTIKEFKQDEHTLSTITVCGARTAAVVSQYSKDAFETVDKSTEAGVTKVISIKGKRTGDCP